MKRIIKDFKNLTPEIIKMIDDQYPSGYSDSQMVTFVNAKGEFVKAIEVKGDDVLYLIKIDRQLDKHLSEQEEDDFEPSDDDAATDVGFDEPIDEDSNED